MADEQKQLLQQVEAVLEADDTLALGRLLKEQRSSDIAEVVELLDDEWRRTIFDVLETPLAAEVLEKVDEATRSELFEILEVEELKSIISHLDADDAADVLQELPEKESAEILKSMSPAESAEIKDLMSYSEDSAGGIMDPVLISVPEDATVAEAISEIRAAEIDEDFYCVYVVDKTGRFLGDVRIRLLLTRPENTKIKSLIDPDTIYVTAHADQEEVRNIFRKNDEDLYTMAGTDADELENISILHAARIRMTWLLPCLIGTAITALVLMFFKSHNPVIYVVAVAFVPMIAAISGNAGLQTSTIVVSGLATGHLAALKLNQVFTREVRIALLVALSCGLIGGTACAILLSARAPESTIEPMRIVFAFGTAMFSAIMIATTLGLFLPFLFRRIGIDPAISSGPLVTTANDSISVAIYMTLTILLAR